MTALRGVKYKRISDDREGRELGVTRQDEDLEALAARRGVKIVGDYTDNDISASTKTRKPRPEYDRMVTDARAGLFDVILCYTSSRLTRRPRENEDLIDLAQAHGIRFLYVRSPEWDLNTADGREYARMAAARDAGEAERTSERVTRAVRQRAENGEFHGGTPPFGYKRLRSGEIKPDRVHADMVREAMRRLLNRESLLGVVTDWNKQGKPTGSTQPRWYSATLKRVVTNPGIIGVRIFEGQALPTPWPAIVDPDDHARLVTLLTDPARTTSHSNRRKYELSGLIRCGRCDMRMTSTSPDRKGDHGAQSYECTKLKGGGGCGRMKIAMNRLHTFVAEQFFAAVDTIILAAEVQRASTPQINDEQTQLHKAIAHDEQALITLADERDDGIITDNAEYVRRRARITTRLDANRVKLAGVVQASVHLALPSSDILRTEWPDMDPIARRDMLSQVVDYISIHPHPAGVTTAPVRRKAETDEEHAHRVELHVARMMLERVEIHWLV